MLVKQEDVSSRRLSCYVCNQAGENLVDDPAMDVIYPDLSDARDARNAHYLLHSKEVKVNYGSPNGMIAIICAKAISSSCE